ncbi:hypothetical protein FRB95_010632 [Tulasnella sp. JGI-2019a]|nr:hypothetical protein FRB95_010632 [Tulasnella sp. JGI-2019a]
MASSVEDSSEAQFPVSEADTSNATASGGRWKGVVAGIGSGELKEFLSTANRLTSASSGIVTGLSKTAVGHGFDTIKTRLQCSPPGTYNGALDCLLKTVRHESVFALYKGATPPAIGWALSDSILLGSLYNYRLWLLERGGNWTTERSPHPPDGPAENKLRLSLLGHGKLKGTRLEVNNAVATGISGGMSAFSFWFFALPMDNIKNRIMSEPLLTHRKSIPQVARTILQTQGWRGFYAGMTPVLLRAFPVNAVAYSVYEGIMRLLGAEKTRQ